MKGMLRGNPITDDDKMRLLASHSEGRARLAEYTEPTDLFLKDRSAKPYHVKDYYVTKAGLQVKAEALEIE